MNIYHRYLKLPFEYAKPNCFNQSYNHPNIMFVKRDWIDNSIIDWIGNFGIKVSNVIEGFYTPPNGGKIPMHNDTPALCNATKINFTWGPHSSTTRWWKVKNESFLIPVNPDNSHITAEGIRPDIIVTNAFHAKEENCDLVYEKVINRPSLMNIGQLHSTYNPDNAADRWTLCLTLLKQNGNHLQFEEALRVFENHIDAENS
jgi:hypothetical protein